MKYRKSGLLLSRGIFESLYSTLLKEFEQKYDVSVANLMDYQLFGYGNYDPTKPNLKQFIFEATDSSINGKYLYNKYLEWTKGKSPIKFTREFTYVYFNALGHRHLADFLKNTDLSKELISEQQSIEDVNQIKLIDEYYIGYNQNEEGKITKSKLIFSRYNETVKWILGYTENGILNEYIYPGEVRFQENGMSFIFENTKNELDRSLFVGFYFDRRVKILPYLIGVFSGFDRDRKPVSGVVLYERKNTILELENEFKNEDIDERITQFIANKRWSTSGTMPQNLNDLPRQELSSDLERNSIMHGSEDPPFYFQGRFQVIFTNQITHSTFKLVINETGRAILENDSFRYTGYAYISEGAILSIQLTYCNRVPHSAQILSFVGRYPKDQLFWVKGSWHGLDETLQPNTQSILIINRKEKISNEKLIEIQKSRLKLMTYNLTQSISNVTASN